MAIANRADTIPAIIQGSTATNTLTVTNGATATLVGSCLVICIASLTRTVTSITDSAGNTWYRVNSNTVAGLFVELWAATLTGAIAATTGTITITMSGTGRFCGSFAEYTGVGPVLNGAVFDNNGTTSPATTGVQTVSNSGDFLITAVAIGATGLLTAQNGTIRDQQTTTTLRAALIENTGSTSLTDSATMTNATWVTAAADVQLFPLDDQLVMTDQLNSVLGLGSSFSDSLNNWSDGKSIQESFELVAIDDLNNWSDVAPAFEQDYVVVITESANFWLDSFSEQFGGAGPPDSVALKSKFMVRIG